MRRKPRVTGEANFALNDDYDYVVSALDFYGGERPSRDSPGEGPEVDLAPFVTVWHGRDHWSALPVDVFILYYAADRGISLSKAEDAIKDKLIEAIIEGWEEPCEEYCSDD